MAPTAYLHLNGTAYELPSYYATPHSRELQELAEYLRREMKSVSDGTKIQEVVIDGVPTKLVIRNAGVDAFALYVTDSGPGPR